MNGTVRSQIDFVAVRREAADATSRYAGPADLNLAPWRSGPRHRPVTASLPWLAGWKLRQIAHGRKPAAPAFSKHALQDCVSRQGPALPELCRRVEQAFACTTAAEGLEVLNKHLLRICSSLFPYSRSRPHRPGGHSGVVSRVREMWQAYRVFKTRRAAEPGCTLFAVWRAYACFQRKWKALHTASRQERRQWITQQIRTAHDAAQRHDMGEVYRIVRLLAPKQKRDPVRIRDKEGHLLDKRQQFEAIFHYFSAAFRRAEAFQHSHCLGSLDTQLDDVVKSIKALKPRKAVPADTPPAEVWQLCPETAAAFFVRVLDHACTESRRLPARMSDCSLLLLPKPGKTSRLPTDLRPLGLQDPSSKVLASALKSKIQAIVLPWLSSHKQFAYCSGKAIDEAISRASGHCRQVRELLQNSQVSVHARRQGKQAQQCCGGVTLSIDLSRAFDQLPRWGLVASLRHAQVPEPLINLVVVVHENCIYRVKHGAYSGDFPLQVGVRQGRAVPWRRCCSAFSHAGLVTNWMPS